MKKLLIVLFLILAVVLIFYLFHLNSNGFFFTTTTPTPTQAESTPEHIPTETPVPTPDPRNEEGVIRAEIAAMLRDAKDLLNEGYTDDAAMVLRDLRTRSLTDAEKAEVDALQASMVVVSD